MLSKIDRRSLINIADPDHPTPWPHTHHAGDGSICRLSGIRRGCGTSDRCLKLALLRHAFIAVRSLLVSQNRSYDRDSRRAESGADQTWLNDAAMSPLALLRHGESISGLPLSTEERTCG